MKKLQKENPVVEEQDLEGKDPNENIWKSTLRDALIEMGVKEEKFNSWWSLTSYDVREEVFAFYDIM